MFSLEFFDFQFFLFSSIFHGPQTFLSKREHFVIGRKHFSSNAKGGREHFSWAANISQQVPRVGVNIFRRPQTFPFERKVLAQSFQGSPILKAKCARSKAKVPKSKSQGKKVILCYPRALRMPLYKECKKLFISSSSPIIPHHHHFTLLIPPFPPSKISPPTSLFPWVGMTMQKGTKRMQLFCKAVAIGRGGVSDSYPAFFLPIATTSNKNF